MNRLVSAAYVIGIVGGCVGLILCLVGLGVKLVKEKPSPVADQGHGYGVSRDALTPEVLAPPPNDPACAPQPVVGPVRVQVFAFRPPPGYAYYKPAYHTPVGLWVETAEPPTTPLKPLPHMPYADEEVEP